MMIAWALFVEVSDQMGTSEIVGVYSGNRLAQEAAAEIKTRRTFIKSVPLDEMPGPEWDRR